MVNENVEIGFFLSEKGHNIVKIQWFSILRFNYKNINRWTFAVTKSKKYLPLFSASTDYKDIDRIRQIQDALIKTIICL